jgi:hypothetical protein
VSSMFPRTGEAIALRIADGHELVVHVKQAERPRIVVTPALPAATNEGIEAAFVASDGTGYRLRGRIGHREMHDTTIEVEGVTPLLGRFLRRFTPERALFADLALLDDAGTVYRRVQGKVRDLALAGAGIAVEGLQSGDELQMTLTDLDGTPVVADLEAVVVHVAAGVAGIAFSQPFHAAPAMAALAATAHAA